MSARAVTLRRRRILGPGINLTPLLDAIFNLVFFFLLATTLRTEELATEVKLPSSESSTALGEQKVTVTLLADGTISYEGKVVSVAELEEKVRELAAEGVTEVMIRGDKEAALGAVFTIIDLCKAAGLKGIFLQSDRKSS